MKGINAVTPLAVAISASAVSASAIPDSLIPSYFKRASSLPEVTVKGNGKNAPFLSAARNANSITQPSLLAIPDSTSVASTTSQEVLQIPLILLLTRPPAHVTLRSKGNRLIHWSHTH